MASFRGERRLRPVTGGTQALRERLAAMPDQELLACVPHRSTDQGWGAAGTMTVHGEQVFLKRLPLSELEHAHPRSTRNRFRLPTWYSYGVGSAGFTSWRELAAHEATSDLAGFPTLLHSRVLPRTAPSRDLPFTDEQYVAYRNGNAAIGRFMAARHEAAHEIWIVLDHQALTAQPWLRDHPDACEDVLAQVFASIDRLQEAGIVHFDAHLNNVVGDGTAWHLTDFGLAMSTHFELSVAERRFLERHRSYDKALALVSLGYVLAAVIGGSSYHDMARDLASLDDLPASVAPELVAALRRYRAVILYMADVLARLQRPTKRSTYDDAVVRDLLRSAGVPA